MVNVLESSLLGGLDHERHHAWEWDGGNNLT